ncbi:M15 family metallopeptidase [Candidatus Saccharibacteria bacterium]|nr:MAG: M15 family metallopeptidase [Candidatus Saccharibacteria bacterium]
MPKKILIAILGVAAIVFAAYTLTPQYNSVQAPVIPINQPKTKVKQVELVLPNASPITARVEDYNQPTSLWAVVSKEHPLPDAHFVPAGLAVPPVRTRIDKSIAEQSLRSDIEPDVIALFGAAEAAGHSVMVASGYRSYEQQQIYFTSYSRQYGEEAANKFSARPGQSEHQTGLAFDVSLTSRECYLEICFSEREAGKWFAAHSYEYGFILRYPEDKTAITQYQYEPWHFRYVGRDLAKALHDSKLTLDEACPYLQAALTEMKARGAAN